MRTCSTGAAPTPVSRSATCSRRPACSMRRCQFRARGRADVVESRRRRRACRRRISTMRPRFVYDPTMRTHPRSACLVACRHSCCSRPARASRAAPRSDRRRGPGRRELARVRRRFIEARMKADPYFAVQAGRHEFDGQMPDWSRAALEADVAQTAPSARRAATVRSRERSTPGAALRARLPANGSSKRQIFWQATAEQPFRNPAWYLDRLDPSMYLDARIRAAAEAARGIPRLRARGARARGATSARTCARRCPRRSSSAARPASAATRPSSATRCPRSSRTSPTRKLKARPHRGHRRGGVGDGRADGVAGVAARDRAPTTSRSARAKFREMLRETERVDLPLEELELVGPQGSRAQPGGARGGVRGVSRRSATLAACVDKMRADKPARRHRRGRPRAARGTAQVRHRPEDRVDSEPGAGAGRGVAAVQPRQLRVHQHSGAVREPGREGHLLRRAAGSEVDRRGTQCLSAGQGAICSSCPRTRCGRATTCSRSSRTRIPRASAALWWDYSFGEGWAHYAEEMMYDAGLGNGRSRDARRHA